MRKQVPLRSLKYLLFRFSMFREKIYSKSLQRSSTDTFLLNRAGSFQKTTKIVVGLSMFKRSS